MGICYGVLDMKKLLIGLLFSVCASAQAITYQAVRASTANIVTPAIQTGTMNISSGSLTNLKVGNFLSTTSFNGGGLRLTNVSTPTLTTDAATKGYVDSIGGGSTNYVQILNTLQPNSTFFVSSGTAVNFNSSTSTITNLSVSSMTTTLPMSGRKITGLANGTVNTDGVAYGQIGMYSILCSSTVSVSSSSTAGVSTWLPTKLGCTATLSNSSHHVYITGNSNVNGTVSGNVYGEAVFVDGVNMDDSTWGQCAADVAATGLTAEGTQCPFVEYYAPGDTSAHAYRLYMSSISGSGTISAGIGTTTQRFIVFEVQ